MSLEHNQSIPELDVSERSWCGLNSQQKPGLEVGQLIRVWVEQALELQCLCPPFFRTEKRGGETGSNLVGAHPTRASGRSRGGAHRAWRKEMRRGWRWSCVCSVFQRSQALHWCQLPHRDGRWSFGSHVFSNAPKVCALVSCFHVVTHPSVGRGSAGHVRKGGPLGRSRTTGGGPVTGLLASATSAALPGARHLGDIVTREEEVEEEGIVDKPFIHGR